MDQSESIQFNETPGSQKLQQAGISIHHDFEPGDLGQLILIHGVQNFRDYGFNPVHEAYCAKIAGDFILSAASDRSKVWLAKQGATVVGSVFIFEQPGNQAQLRLLFVDSSVRGCGLGRWLVEKTLAWGRESVEVRYELVFGNR
jgi:GNAT superfamily N-acetyltransferase